MHCSYLLAAAEVEYEDVRFSFEEFEKMKACKSACEVLVTVALFVAFPQPVCPLLEDDKGRVMQQSLAIGQFVAQKYG